MTEKSEIKPIHGQSFFTLSYNGVFQQILIFDYFDPDKFYYRILHDEESYKVEMQKLLNSMNQLLSREEIRINGERVKAEALTINLDFRGEAEKPTISFYIEFAGKLNSNGENVYENRYEPGIAEYDYEVYWFFPEKTKIIEVVTDTNYEICDDRFLILWARTGDHYGGYERIRFILRS